MPGSTRTRELGILINLTPIASQDGKRIDITGIYEVGVLSKLGLMETMAPGAPQPDVYSWNMTTTVAVKNGATVLLAVVDPVANGKYKAHENVVLFLLTAAVNRPE